MEDLRSKFTNIFVKNIEENVTDEQLKELFEPHGPILSIILQKDQDGHSRGFGFVNYENHGDASKAVESLHLHEINGKPLYVARAQKKVERGEELRRQYEKMREERMNKYQGVNLYVKNLEDTVDDEQLRQEFSAYGTITSAKIMKDDKIALDVSLVKVDGDFSA